MTNTHTPKQAGHLNFGCHVWDEDKSLAPHVCCLMCYVNLTKWMKEKNSMLFAIPMIWHEPSSHLEDHHFCLTKIEGHTKKSSNKIQYTSIPSAVRPVPHGDKLPLPKPCSNWDEFTFTKEQLQEGPSSSSDPSYFHQGNQEPYMIQPSELNDLVCDFNISKQ